MSIPAIQLLTARSIEDGSFGVAPFGVAPFGGTDPLFQQIPNEMIQLGSDDLTLDINRFNAGITIERYGIPISHRVWKQPRLWNLNINVAPISFITQLRPYFEARTFWLYPDVVNTNVRYKVFWREDTFSPTYLAPGKYSISCSFIEVN